MAATETITISFGSINVSFTRTTIQLPKQADRDAQFVYRISAKLSSNTANFTLILPTPTRFEECVIMLVRDGLYGAQNHSVDEYADEYLVEDVDAVRIKERMEAIATGWRELHLPVEVLESFYEETLG